MKSMRRSPTIDDDRRAAEGMDDLVGSIRRIGPDEATAAAARKPAGGGRRLEPVAPAGKGRGVRRAREPRRRPERRAASCSRLVFLLPLPGRAGAGGRRAVGVRATAGPTAVSSRRRAERRRR
jgi:hypothetical protein